MSWSETTEAAEFIASAASRETSPELMEAIAHFARSAEEADLIWEDGPDHHGACTMLDLWERATKNGLIDDSHLFWGASGNQWWPEKTEL